MRKRNVLVGMLVTVACSTNGQPPVKISDALDEQNFMPYQITYLIDSSRQLTLGQVRHLPYAARFQTNPGYVNTDFRQNAVYWIRLPIRHSAASRKIWLLEFYDQTIDHIEAHLPTREGGYKTEVMGDQQPFHHRFFSHKNFELLLDMPRDTVVTYYFKITSREFADIRIALRSVNRFVFYALNEYFLFGTFYGMILIISLYNFLVYLAIREVKHIYYICYILSVAGYAMSLDGIGFQYLWPQQPGWNNYATGVFLFLLIAWSLVFTRAFLATAENAPLLDRLLKWMLLARFAWFAVSLLFFPHLLTYRNPDIIPLLAIFYTAICVWRNGYKPARFFVVAYGLLFAGFVLRMLVYFNLLPFTIGSHYSLHFSFVMEMLFLTFALGDRIRILKNARDRLLRSTLEQQEENIRLQNKVNRELEEKVRERTDELARKNHELARQAEEIRHVNSQLDKDNWRLKNSIREIRQEYLFHKDVSYTEFQSIFTDEAACYRYLDLLKWKDGFRCRKCSHDHFSESARLFSRRCTRCGYEESVTAHTIFQGVRFPISKAFYLVYLEMHFPQRYTLDALVALLDLRRNTIWSFRRKIQNALAQTDETDLILNHNNWHIQEGKHPALAVN